MMRFQGTTEQAGGTFLGADFWEKGVKIAGVVSGTFETSNGTSYSVMLREPVKVKGANGKPTEEKSVSIGSMKGFLMALRAAGVPNQELLAGDVIVLECTGKTPTNKGNDQVNFKVLVDRQ
ncbi:MAG: hypothetical protein C5B59_12390 [Bacteroidetes bacterium]|nr:MAG: hypothetical protein C5B59_12390 [Bacteroidota bacterium]